MVACYTQHMAVSDAELARMRTRLKERECMRADALRRRLAKARGDFNRIVAHIAESYRPHRIYQWGSLIEGAHFTERSDIDIAVEGIESAQEYFAILRDAEEMTSFPVDIVQMETIHPEYARSIRSRGRIVHEQ